MSQEATDPDPSPLPRSIEILLAQSRKLRAEADRLEEQASRLHAAIREDEKLRIDTSNGRLGDSRPVRSTTKT
jgi:hypothetical protein